MCNSWSKCAVECSGGQAATLPPALGGSRLRPDRSTTTDGDGGGDDMVLLAAAAANALFLTEEAGGPTALVKGDAPRHAQPRPPESPPFDVVKVIALLTEAFRFTRHRAMNATVPPRCAILGAQDDAGKMRLQVGAARHVSHAAKSFRLVLTATKRYFFQLSAEDPSLIPHFATEALECISSMRLWTHPITCKDITVDELEQRPRVLCGLYHGNDKQQALQEQRLRRLQRTAPLWKTSAPASSSPWCPATPPPPPASPSSLLHPSSSHNDCCAPPSLLPRNTFTETSTRRRQWRRLAT